MPWLLVAVVGLVLLTALPSLAQEPQPAKNEGGAKALPDSLQKKSDEPLPELRIYSIGKNANTKAIEKSLQEKYKASSTLRITAVGATQIMVYAPNDIQKEIARELPAQKNGFPGGPLLMTYTLKSAEAKKVAEELHAIYMPTTILAINDKQIMAFTDGKIHGEIVERLKNALFGPPAEGDKKVFSDVLKKARQHDARKIDPVTLEEALEKALKYNPDILLAAAKVKEAESEVNRMRLAEGANHLSHKADFDATEAIWIEAIAKHNRLKQLQKNKGVVTEEELEVAKATVDRYYAELAQKKVALRGENEKANILVAEAKLRLAEAELSRLQQDVATKINWVFADIGAAKATLNEAEKKIARLTALREKNAGLVSQEELGVAEATVARYKADLAKKEATLPYLIGKESPQSNSSANNPTIVSPNKPLFGASTTAAKPSPIQVRNAEKLRKLLDTSISFNLSDGNMNMKEAIFFLNAKAKSHGAGELNVLLSPEYSGADKPAKLISLPFNVTVAATLQMIEDNSALRFVIRDYGIVGMDAKNVPPGALFVSDFMKSAPSIQPEKK